MNCSTAAASRPGHFNTHLYHPYARNGQFIGQSSQEPADLSSLKSFNQQLGINCSVNQLNTGLPAVSSTSYSGLLATVSHHASKAPQSAYNAYLFDNNSHFGHLNHLSSHLNGHLSNLSHDLSNSVSGHSDDERRGLHSLASNQQLNYSSQLDQVNFNQLNHSDQLLNHLAESDDHHSNHSNANYSGASSNQTSVIVCNTKVSDPSFSTPSIGGSSTTDLPGGFSTSEGTRSLENDDEIDFVMAYISSSQDEQRKIYSNQNSTNQTELTNASHQLNKENHNQLINNQVSGFFKSYLLNSIY